MNITRQPMGKKMPHSTLLVRKVEVESTMSTTFAYSVGTRETKGEHVVLARLQGNTWWPMVEIKSVQPLGRALQQHLSE